MNASEYGVNVEYGVNKPMGKSGTLHNGDNGVNTEYEYESTQENENAENVESMEGG